MRRSSVAIIRLWRAGKAPETPFECNWPNRSAHDRSCGYSLDRPTCSRDINKSCTILRGQIRKIERQKSRGRAHKSYDFSDYFSTIGELRKVVHNYGPIRHLR